MELAKNVSHTADLRTTQNNVEVRHAMAGRNCCQLVSAKIVLLTSRATMEVKVVDLKFAVKEKFFFIEVPAQCVKILKELQLMVEGASRIYALMVRSC